MKTTTKVGFAAATFAAVAGTINLVNFGMREQRQVAQEPQLTMPSPGVASPRFIVFQESADGPFKVAQVERSLTAAEIETKLDLQTNWYGCKKASSPEEAIAEAKAGGFKFVSASGMNALRIQASSLHLVEPAIAGPMR